MQKTEKAPREPWIRLTKRRKISRAGVWGIRVTAFLLGMLVCGIAAFFLIDKLRDDPSMIGKFYLCFIDGSFARTDTVWKLFKDLSILLCIALALTPAFRMRFWNTGAEGQTLVGVLAAMGIDYFLGGTANPTVALPDAILVPLMLAGALLAGAVWGVIPALFKAKWNTNETLFTLMMNYVATYLVSYCLLKWITSGSAVMPKLATGGLPVLFGQEYLLIILIVFVLAAAMFFYMRYSKHGYEISVVGESENTARYVGINVKTVIIRTMLLSGMLCGLAGFLIASGLDRSVNPNSVRGQGFTAIMVSWLAKFNPLEMILTSGIVTFLKLGGETISTVFDVSSSLPNVIIGIELFFIIGCEFFINFKVHIGRHSAAGKEAIR